MTRVVIDACVTIAAGDGTGVLEPARESMAVLDAVMSRGRSAGDLRLAVNPELLDEWNNRRDAYSVSWLAEMTSRRLVDDETSAWADEAQFLGAASKNHRAPLAQDIHVVRLAMVTERRLISLEQKLPRYIKATMKRSGCPGGLESLHYVRPTEPRAVPWIAAGAPEDPSWFL